MSSLYAFWFLNHRLDQDELRWQLEQLKEQGFSGVFPHPRDGLLTPYMSAEWLDAVRFIAKECKRLGLEFWLYDEDPYPSGVASGRVVYDRPEFTCRYLEFVERDAHSAGGEITADFPMGCLLKVFAWPARAPAEFLDVTEHCGPLRAAWRVMGKVTSGYYPPYTRMGRPHWRAAAAGPFYRLQCALPAGAWKIAAVFERRGQNNKWGVYPDLMNPDAVDYFIQLTHERYRKALGPALFKTVRGVFTDEAKLVGELPWTPALPARFKRRTGENLLALLPHLKYRIDERTDAVRNAYRRVTGELFRDAYTKRLAAWCGRHGIKSTGHLSPEEDPLGQQRMIPDLMNLLKDFQTPGSDLISSNIGTRGFCILNIGQKLVASVARQQGRRDALCEALGVSGEDLSLERAKRMLDWLFALGVNKIVVHGQFYSLDGHRKREAPPSIFWQAPYWPHFRALADYVQRVAGVLRRGERLCDIAVLYPTAHLNALWPERQAEAEAYRQHLGELCFALLGRQIDFDFVSEADLLACSTERNGLRVGRAFYRVLVVPETPMLEEAVGRKLKQLAARGDRVLIVNRMPASLESGETMSLAARLTSMDALPGALARRAARPLAADGADALFRHSRRIGRARWHFLFNAGDAACETSLTVESGAWLAVDGDAKRPLPEGKGGRPAASIPPLGAVLLKEIPRPTRRPAARPRRRLPLTNWAFEPLEDNTLVLKDWRVGPSPERIRRRLDLPLDYEPPPGAEEAWFETVFSVKARPASARLVWDAAAMLGRYEIYVNDRRVDDIRPARVYDQHNLAADIAARLVPGRNRVRVRVRGAQPKLIEPLRVYGRFAASAGKPPSLRAAAWPARLTRLRSWTELGLPHYSGLARYAASFDAPPGARRARVRLGRAAVSAKVILNGEECGVAAWAPWECDASAALRPGRNELRVEVANTSINALEGEPSESGLLGPAEIVFE